MSVAVLYEVVGGVATLTMDRPENRNALTPALLNGLGDGLTAGIADPAVRVMVLTHSGPAFCAGVDLSTGRGVAGSGGGGDGGPRSGSGAEAASGSRAGSGGAGSGAGAGSESAAADTPRFGLADVLTSIQDSPKPVVARITGHCMGGGVGLAAACDLSVATEDVRFGFTEVRLGLAPAIISVVCLPKLRRADALDLFLTGERIPAARAAEVGLINLAVPAAELDARVEALIAKLLAGGPGGLAAAKRLVFDVPDMERRAAFEQTATLSDALFASEEAAEGMAAFREKRQASWVPAAEPAEPARPAGLAGGGA